MINNKLKEFKHNVADDTDNSLFEVICHLIIYILTEKLQHDIK